MGLMMPMCESERRGEYLYVLLLMPFVSLPLRAAIAPLHLGLN